MHDRILYHFREKARHWSKFACIRRPDEGGPRRNIAITSGYLAVKKSNRFNTVPACDRQTDGQIDGHLVTA